MRDGVSIGHPQAHRVSVGAGNGIRAHRVALTSEARPPSIQARRNPPRTVLQSPVLMGSASFHRAADTYPARVAPSWTEEKLMILEAYLDAFADACKSAGGWYGLDASPAPGSTGRQPGSRRSEARP
jgi:hypothetical protein